MKFNETSNFEGGEAYEPVHAEQKLYKITINNLLEDTYYREDETAFQEILTVAQEVDTEFLCKLAAYARQEHGLRDVSQLLLVIAAGREDNEIVREYAPDVISRADEPMKILGAWEMVHGPITMEKRARKYIERYSGRLNSQEIQEVRKIANGNPGDVSNTELLDAVRSTGRALSNPLQDGIEMALHNFDEYQFAKYNSDNRDWNMQDVLNLVRPKPRDETRGEIFERLIYGDLDSSDIEPLDSPTTWEVVISERGNTESAWREVLPRMGLFAKIRNLRNLAEHGFSANDIFDKSDLDYVENSKIYPFRFYQAHLALRKSIHTMPNADRYLAQMIHHSLDTIKFGNSLVCPDMSGSMESPLSQKSDMTYAEISAFMGAVMSYEDNVVMPFASEIDRVRFETDSSIFQRIEKIKNTKVGGSTNGWKCIRWAKNQYDTEFNRIIMLTDMQIWDSQGGFYGDSITVKEEYDDMKYECPLYMVDMSSYGHLVTPSDYENVYNVNGWNSKIIDFINEVERPNAVDEVKKYEPGA